VNTPAPTSPEPDYELTGAPDNYLAPASTFYLRKFLAALRKRWWVPVLALALFLGAASGYLLWTPPTYVSQASMWETEKLRLPGGELFSEDPQDYIGNQTELIQSDKLEQLTLAGLQTVMTNGIPRDKDGKPLKVKLAVKQAAKSSVFQVEASGSNPAYVQVYLDSLMNQYLEYRKNIHKVISGDTLASISEQVLRLERDLKADQDALTTFEQSNNLAILQEEGTVAGGYLERLQTQLSDYKLESQLLEATALENGTNGAGARSLTASSVDSLGGQNSASSAVATGRDSAFQQVELLKFERQKLSKYLRPNHPKIVKLDGEIEKSQKLIELYNNQSREQLAATRQSLKMKSDSVQASIKEWEAKVIDANARIAEADHLKLNVNRTQSLYDRLVTLLQNVDISRNINQDTLAILDPAAPAIRSYTRESSVMALALMGGLAVGLGIVLLLAVRDDRFTSVIEVNATFGDSVVGLLPEMTQKDKAAMTVLEPNDPRYMYAESYRSLRSALLFQPIEGERPRVLLITSTLPSEGKSTIAANLARTMALAGSRVLLVDADLRKGHLHEMLGMQCAPGLVELLQQPDNLDRLVQGNSLQNFAFLSRGKDRGLSSDVFLGGTFDQILARMRRQFDYVVIDSSPVFAADDASTLAPKADGTLFVVRSNFTSARQVREALELLHHRQAKVLGLVFNRADASARSYHYYKYADYHRSDNGFPNSITSHKK
jgi:capsular exopolysaccharide synthesis family protein